MRKFEELLVNKGLYDSVKIYEEDYDILKPLLESSIYKVFKIDTYCTKCKEKRTFESIDLEVHEKHYFSSMAIRGGEPIEEEPLSKKFKKLLGNRYSISFICTRDSNHTMLFDLMTTDNSVVKIGQFPSYADISAGDLSKYKSILKSEYVEFSKSIGLFSHGIGIGSFVYLRRIIETLVMNKFETNKDKISTTDEEFRHSEFKDKIKIVSDYIPEILVKNTNIYGILSKGIHELSEDECLEIFPYMRIAIELILDDLISKKEKDEKEKKISDYVSSKTGELKNR